MKKLLFILMFLLMGCGEETTIINNQEVMINLSSIFKEANNQSEKERDVLVMVEDVTLFDEKATEGDWGNNVSESNVDYTSSPPDAGNVILTEYSGVWVCDDATDKIYNIKTDGTLVSSFATSVFDASATSPQGISYSPDGTLWICNIDVIGSKIYNIETDGTLISSFIASIDPYDISYALDGTLWVTDNVTNKIHNLETNGTLISEFATSIFDASATAPTGISFALDGTLWVCDAATDKIYNIETDGTLISSFLTSVFDASATGLQGISYSPDGTLWVCDAATDKIYNIETDGILISSFATSVFDASAIVPTGLTFSYKHQSTGHITTDTIDIGEVPTTSGEWAIEDITPDDSDITYEAWYSTTGVFGGEEVSIGAIIDGQTITDLKRYWRVKASFTANTARDETPTLQSIKADYTTYRRFNKIPDLGYEPLVTSLSSLTSKVDFFKPASIGQISVGIQMTDAVSDWVYADTLYNKIVQVKLGFKYDGFGESDYIHYFTGAIDDWTVNDRVLNLTLKDLSKDWKLPVPSKWEIGDDVTWTNEHHTNVILDIFQNHINVRDSGLLLDSFATVKAATSGYKVTRTITGKTEDAKKLVEELRVLLMAFFLPRGDGKIGIKQFDSTEAIVVTFTDDNTMGITWKANSKDLINRTHLYSNWDGDGEKEVDFSDYDGGPVADPSTSETKFQATKPYILKDKWTRTAEATQISDLETKILDQFDDMPARVTISCDAKDIAYEAGDMVGVTTLEAPGNNGAGIIDEKYLLVSKNLDFLGDKIVFEGLKVAV